jgi:UDP-N-acetylglucosamine 4,6-dehydratase/5-epimerase
MDYLHGKLILVIGGTGDFCKAIFRSALQHLQQSRIAVLSRDELNQYGFRPEIGDHLWIRWFIRIACDRGRLSRAVSGVDVVEHAAAMKQLDTNDYNSFDCIAIDGMVWRT